MLKTTKATARKALHLLTSHRAIRVYTLALTAAELFQLLDSATVSVALAGLNIVRRRDPRG